ncbi:MAG: cell envelope integrity protein TolA [Xanthomonadales bacterium]
MFSRQELGAQFRAFSLALGVHVLMAMLVVVSTMKWEPFRKPQNVGLTIEAVIVDTSEIRRQREQAKRAAEREDLRRKRAERLEQQKKQKARKDLEAKQRREQELEAQRKRDAQDRLQKLRMERQRKREDERLKQARELEDIRKQREAADKQRKLEEQRLRQIEDRRQDEALEQRRQLEAAERKQQVEAEQRAFRAGQIATLRDKYQLAIQSVVTQNWLRPPTAQPGLRCTLKIVQIPGGEVISAAIAGKCNGDPATRRSIVAAVERVGILPYRGFENVFRREIDFYFIYDGD